MFDVEGVEVVVEVDGGVAKAASTGNRVIEEGGDVWGWSGVAPDLKVGDVGAWGLGPTNGEV